MAGETLTPNMNLPLPAPGTTSGPTWAQDLNASLTLVDLHNHAAGSGVQITPSGININADLTFANNNATNAKSVRFFTQSAALAGASDLVCLYSVGVDLYFNDGSGNQIRITQSGAVAGTPGSISSLVSPASASYSAGSSTFIFQSAANTAANLDAASLLIRNSTASSFALTLNPPSAMAANFALTLPSLPASQKIMTLDNSGNMSAPYGVDNSTIEISSNNFRVKPQGIAAASIANGTITGTQVASNINLPGTEVKSASKNVVVSNTNETVGLSIIRGAFDSAGTSQFTGASVTRSGTGTYTVSYTTAFLSAPSVVASPWVPSGTPGFSNAIVFVYGAGASGCSIAVQDTAGSALDFGVMFQVIGVRSV